MAHISAVVIMDDDGHFQAALTMDRREVMKVLKRISDGEYYPDIIKSYNLEDVDPWTLNLVEWKSFIYNFVQRGTCEIVEI
jgi:hypothetical protein